MSTGFQAPADWGYTGYDNYNVPSYSSSSDWWTDLGTGFEPNLSSYGLTYGTLPISTDSYLGAYTLPYSSTYNDSPGIWESIQAGNYGDALGSVYDELGGLKGVASLGLGGLSLLGNYLAKKDAEEMAREQFDRTLALREKDLAATQATDLAKVDAMMNMLNQRGRVQLDPRRYAEIVASGQIPVDVLATQERIDIAPQQMRQGGLGLLRGGTTGQSDKINAQLSDGEYVMDADVVAALGDGNTEAGAAKLDAMREEIRRHKRSASAKDIPPPAKSPLAYMKKFKGARR